MKRLGIPLFSALVLVGFVIGCVDHPVDPSPPARDPGVRAGAPGGGAPIAGLTKRELDFFEAGKADFAEEEEVAAGLGPTMNLGSCGGCHLQPALGGTSPPVNPQVAFASKNGATNAVPTFITLNGPVREARFVRNPDGTPDGGVHDLFTITGRTDAAGCKLAQPDFEREIARRNIIFRIPTPVFGAGLIEQIPDKTILANQTNDASTKSSMSIRGRPNITLAGRRSPVRRTTMATTARSPDSDGRLRTNLCWSSPVRPTTSKWASPTNSFKPSVMRPRPASLRHFPTTSPIRRQDAPGSHQCDRKIRVLRTLPCPAHAFVRYARRGRLHCARPKPVQQYRLRALSYADALYRQQHRGSTQSGSEPVLRPAGSRHGSRPGRRDQSGTGGPERISDGSVMGLGQRLFFLHDGRTSDLLEAIRAHESGSHWTGDASEANGVVRNFDRLRNAQKQDVLNFLRSL